MRQFFLLGSNIFKWQKLYDEILEPSSWVWSWFPDAIIWKGAVDEYEEDAVGKVLAQNQAGDGFANYLSALLLDLYFWIYLNTLLLVFFHGLVLIRFSWTWFQKHSV